MMDKAYLRKEVDSLEGRLQKIGEEREQQAETIDDLKRQQQELYSKLLAVRPTRSQAGILVCASCALQRHKVAYLDNATNS